MFSLFSQASCGFSSESRFSSSQSSARLFRATGLTSCRFLHACLFCIRRLLLFPLLLPGLPLCPGLRRRSFRCARLVVRGYGLEVLARFLHLWVSLGVSESEKRDHGHSKVAVRNVLNKEGSPGHINDSREVCPPLNIHFTVSRFHSRSEKSAFIICNDFLKLLDPMGSYNDKTSTRAAGVSWDGPWHCRPHQAICVRSPSFSRIHSFVYRHIDHPLGLREIEPFITFCHCYRMLPEANKKT